MPQVWPKRKKKGKERIGDVSLGGPATFWEDKEMFEISSTKVAVGGKIQPEEKPPDESQVLV